MKEQGVLRFALIHRIEHWVMVAAFVTLACTGLPQKYPEAGISLWFFRLVGGIEKARMIHHGAAVVFVLIPLVHLGSVGYDLLVLGKRPSLWFTRQDFTNAWHALLYNLGLRREKPKQGWFTFEEKLEYWALIWGSVVMIVTGFFLWNPILVSTVFPGDWIPAAKIAHGSEAVLAVLAVLVWHTYHVHLKRFNLSMFTGKVSAEELQDEHPLWLEQGPEPPRYSPEQQRVRRRWFWVGYAVVVVLWLAGTYGFVNAEVTATASPPPLPELAHEVVYQPPRPTPVPTPAVAVSAGETPTWAEVGPWLAQRCGYCHTGRHGFGGLDVGTRDRLLQGGVHGPAVVPGQPGASPLWFWPQREDHPIHLTEEELGWLWRWIAAGAP